MNKSIDNEAIQRILKQADIVDTIGEYVHLKKSGRNYLGLCPFHQEKTPSFSVSPEKQFYHCFGCGAGGNVFSFLMDIEGYSFTQAVKHVADKLGVQVDVEHTQNEGETQVSKEKQLLLKAHSLAAQLFHHVLLERKEGEQARRYLQGRGIRYETLIQFQIGYAPDSWDFLTQFLQKRDFPLDLLEKGGLIAKGEKGKYFDRFRDRVIFPIWDNQNNVIAFAGRVLGDSHPKYLNSPESILFEKSKVLYHYNLARQEIRKEKKAIIFEGFADVISAWQAGIKNATAGMGTSLSSAHARMLARNSDEVILCFDGDQAGREALLRNAEVFEGYSSDVKIAECPDGYDPDGYIQEFGAKAFNEQILANRKTVLVYQMDSLRRNRNLQDDAERVKYVNECLKLIAKQKNAIEREHYLLKLAKEFSLTLEALKHELKQIDFAQKRKQQRDNQPEKWNNSRNIGKRLVAKQMFPAYQTAERYLLAHMLTNRELTFKIQSDLGTSFNIGEHNALAAYLYTFYAKGNNEQLDILLSHIGDEDIRKLAIQLSMLQIEAELNEKALQDYLYEIKKQPLKEQLALKEQEKQSLEKQGRILEAAHLAKEIIETRKQLDKFIL